MACSELICQRHLIIFDESVHSLWAEQGCFRKELWGKASKFECVQYKHTHTQIYIYVHRLITWYFDPDQSPLHPFSTMFHGCLFTSTFKEQLAQIRRTRLAPQQVVAKKKSGRHQRRKWGSKPAWILHYLVVVKNKHSFISLAISGT